MKKLISDLNFKFPKTTNEEKLKIAKTSERNANFLYKLIRNEYKRKYDSTSSPNNQIYQDSIDALDHMHEKYLQLKKKIDLKSSMELIELNGKWFTYIKCIESMFKNITGEKNDKSDSIKARDAKVLSKELWEDFDKRLQICP